MFERKKSLEVHVLVHYCFCVHEDLQSVVQSCHSSRGGTIDKGCTVLTMPVMVGNIEKGISSPTVRLSDRSSALVFRRLRAKQCLASVSRAFRLYYAKRNVCNSETPREEKSGCMRLPAPIDWLNVFFLFCSCLVSRCEQPLIDLSGG